MSIDLVHLTSAIAAIVLFSMILRQRHEGRDAVVKRLASRHQTAAKRPAFAEVEPLQ